MDCASSGYLEVMSPRVLAHSCQWDPRGHRGSFGMDIHGSRHYALLCHQGIVWEFENFSRVMLKFTSSISVVGSFPSCLVTMGKWNVSGWIQKEPVLGRNLRGVRTELSEGGQVKGAHLGPRAVGVRGSLC